MKRIDALILDAGGVLVHPVHGDWNIPARYRELMGDCARDIPGAAWMEACRAESATLREDVIVPDMAAERALRLKFLRDVAARMGWRWTARNFPRWRTIFATISRATPTIPTRSKC